MTTRTSIRLLLAQTAALAAALIWVATATAGDTYFDRGKVEGLAVDGKPFSHASFQNLHAEFDECGALPNEASCTWSVEVVVHHSSPCAGEETAVPWSSGEIAGNGSVDSGPQAIDLSACPGAGLTLTQWFKKTYGPWEGPGDPPLYYQTGAGQTIGLLTESVAELEEQIIRNSPAAQPEPMPDLRLSVSPDCRRLTLGPTSFVFKFKRIGCRTATNIAARVRWGNEANGYRCTRRSGGGARCWRIGQLDKYVEWHRPRGANAKN